MKNKDDKMQDKYKNMHQGTSTSQLRHKIKERFLNTLQGVRRKNIDARRFSNTSDLPSKPKIYSMKDLSEILLENKNLKELISPEEIDEIFNEVQKEIGWTQEDGIDLYDPEVQSVMESLTTYCIICEQISDKAVCELCGNEHFTESL